MGNCVPARPAIKPTAPRSLAALIVGAALTLTGCQASWDFGAGDDSEVLDEVSLHASDASAGAQFALVPHGDEVTGQVSLDLCQTEYPSERKRRARHQVQIGDPRSGNWVSSEAIAYVSPKAAEQAMSELAATAETCKETGYGGGSAVIQDVARRAADDEGLRWSFEDDPDANWPQTPGVARQTYAFELSDQLGNSASYVTTYLQRGRILVAVYVTPPDSGAAVLVNAPSQERLIKVMSARLAAPAESEVS